MFAAQALSVMAAAYGIYHGPEGIKHIGENIKICKCFAEKIKTNLKFYR